MIDWLAKGVPARKASTAGIVVRAVGSEEGEGVGMPLWMGRSAPIL